MTPIELDSQLARKLEQGMRTGDSTELPFPVVYIWALNGQGSYRSEGGALYYGGWASKSEDLQDAAEAQNLDLPKDWVPVTISSRDGGEFEAYTARNIIIAPIGKRLSWLHDGKRSSAYVEGGRRHLQILAYLAENRGESEEPRFKSWGPVVLTAKGYQARNVLDALARWEKATASIRRKVAPQIPAWCFYLSLGTYEKERQAINVGKPGAQSPITPITAYIPEKLTEKLMEDLFVGSEVANAMSEYHDQASDWLKAWSAEALVEVFDESEHGFGSHEELPY
jgi:hypothetical protein